jgi:putative ABC transport system permease protein
MLTNEALSSARAHAVASSVIALLAGAVCATILATVGQLAASESRIIRRFDEAGTRTVVVSDSTGRARLHADSVVSVAAMDGVADVFGFGPVIDVHNAMLDTAAIPVPARRFYGDLAPGALIVEGRLPLRGEGIAGTVALRALGLAHPAGAVTDGIAEFPIVGWFLPTDVLGEASRWILVPGAADANDPSALLRELRIVTVGADQIEAVMTALPALVDADDRSQLVISGPAALVELRGLVEGEVRTGARGQLLLILGVGMITMVTTVFGVVAQARRDFGRRRALGAPRTTLVVLVVAQTCAPALVGVVLGSVVGVLATISQVAYAPPLDFVGAVALLTLLAAAVSAIPPGVHAAMADPLRILRVP